MKKAFTLAEVMIVLAVIGILTAILLPAAFHTTPNEKIIKFKNAHNTLNEVINQLVSSDQYYKDGDLGTKADGTLVDSATYFCQTFADVINTQEVSCSSAQNNVNEQHLHPNPNSESNIALYKGRADEWCKKYQIKEIVSKDVTYYSVSPYHHFAITYSTPVPGTRLFGTVNVHDSYGFDSIYKLFCMDIDGINNGEDPFGYGIRIDGKIFTGARADQWLNKGIQDKE